MEKISYAGCFGLSPAILVQFTFEMCVSAQNRQKIHYNPLFCGFEVTHDHQCWHS